MSRKPGPIVHRLSREVDRPNGLGPGKPYIFVRCVCGAAFPHEAKAATIEQARALYAKHLDRVEAAGKAVDREAPATHPASVEER